jgi:hypothetical protein
LLKIVSDDSSPVVGDADTKPVMDATCLLVQMQLSINKPTGETNRVKEGSTGSNVVSQ